MKLAPRVQAIKPSATLAVSARARELRASGKDVIGLGAGEPDFDTPAHIKDAAIKAIRDGETKYTAVDGTPGLKDAVRDKFERENGLRYSADQILVSSGAKHCLYNLFQALLNKGDDVVIPAPYWVSYPDMALLSGATPVVVPATIEQDFKITPRQLQQAMSASTRLFIINSPSNPSGRAYTREELRALGAVLRDHEDVIIVTDDIYEHILWTGDAFCNILNACPELEARTVVINGVSKAYAMTGWRIGYAAGPSALIAAMRKIQSQSTSNPASISQAAAIAALAGDQGCITPMVREFKKRHDQVLSRLNRLNGVTAIPSDGTFYAFPDFSAAIDSLDGVDDDVELAAFLLDECGVALVPGSAFGAPGHLRLSYATDMDTLNDALDRLERVLGTD